MATKKDEGPPRWHSRTVAGVTLEPGLWESSTDFVWMGIVEGERWVFVQKGHKRWQGFSADHLTGTPIVLSLGRTVLWVIEHADEWKAKLKVRRKAGTRMVDPKVA